MQLVVLCAGLFVIAASVFDWDWFFDNRKAILFTDLFGRTGARVFYFFLGIVILYLSYVLHVAVEAQNAVGS